MLIWVSIWFVWGVNFITTYYSSCQFGLCGVSSWFVWGVHLLQLVWGVNLVIMGSVWGVNLVTTCYGLCGGSRQFSVLIWVSILFVWGVHFITTYSSCQVGLYGVSIYYSWCGGSIWFLWVLCGVSIWLLLIMVRVNFGLCGVSI